MIGSLPLGADRHVHSDFSDDAEGSLADVVAAAAAAGLHEVLISDHVRATTTWLPEYGRAVRDAAAAFDGELLCGVEAKLMDSTGTLDLPDLTVGVQSVLISDHQWPGPHGPVPPAEVRRRLAVGTLTPAAVIDTLVTACARALRRVPGPQLAHPFSLLPKVGLSEDAVTGEHLDALAEVALAFDAAVEVNEKWRCPSRRVSSHLRDRGVRLVAGSDSHTPASVGRYDWVAAMSQELAAVGHRAAAERQAR
jgi:putative hydrolase